MRPKTKKRLVVLALAGAGILTIGGTAYTFRQHQIQAKLMNWRAEGMSAYAKGDYETALKDLSNYVGKRQSDSEALLAYGISRTNIVEADNRQVVEGIGIFRRYLDLNPGDNDARHKLLDLYTKAGYAAEAVKLSDELLAKDPKDADALLAKARALFTQRKLDEAIPVAQKFNDLRPLDLFGQELTFQLLWNLKKPAAEIIARYDKLREQHPNDGRFELLSAIAYVYGNDATTGRQWLDKAAAREPDSAEYVRLLADLYDRLGQFNVSQAVIERSIAKNNDPAVMQILITRFWQNGQYSSIADRLANLDATKHQSDTSLLGYRAVALMELGKKDEAAPIVDALAARKDDPKSIGWSLAIHAGYLDDMAPLAAIKQLDAAIVRDPRNFVARTLQARIYAKIGETELALQVYRQLADMAPMWSTPYTEMARLYVSTNRPDSAHRAAEEAYKRDPSRDNAVELVQAEAMIAEINPAEVPTLISAIKTLRQMFPDEMRLTPVHAVLLVRTGHRDDAVKLVNECLAAKNVDQTTLLKLATASRITGLGMEKAILDRELALRGITPQLALAKANELGAGKSADGVKLIESMKADAKSNDSEWGIVSAQFRESQGDPTAQDNWKALTAQYPQSPRVQMAALGAYSAWKDRDFIAQTVDRLKAVTGDNAVAWRLARARYLLTNSTGSATANDRDTGEAVFLLSEIVRTSPDLVAPRLMLAKALKSVNNTVGGIEQLTAAAELDPSSPGIVAELIRLLQAQGRIDDARTAARRIASNPALTPAQRTRFATVLAELGDTQGAMSLLNKLNDGVTPQTGDSLDVTRAAALADLYRRQGRLKEAADEYTKILGRKDIDVDSALAAADFFSAHHDAASSRKAIDLVLARQLAPGVAELIKANYDEHAGEIDSALTHYVAATKAAPQQPGVWLQLAGYYLRTGKLEQAAAASRDASAALPNDASISALRNDVATIQPFGSKPELRVLTDSISHDPTDPALVETIALLANSSGAITSTETMRALDSIADRHPRFLPAHVLLLQGQITTRHFDDAANAATRAMAALPNSMEAARIASAAYMSAGKWEYAVTAAHRWHDLSLDNPLAADLAMADSDLHLNNPAAALQVLSPYINSGQQVAAATYSLAARALIESNRTDDAANLLKPLAAKSANWRATWLSIAKSTMTSKEAASAWIEQITSIIPQDSMVEQYSLAQTWYDCGQKFSEMSYVTKARDILAPLVAREDVKPAILLLAGRVDEALGDLPSAELAYRKLVTIEPKSAIGLNNLAYVLYLENKDLNDAAKSASAAIALAPETSDYHDTLARVHAKLGQTDLATKSFQEALRLEPNKLDTLIGLADAFTRGGQRNKAASLLEQIDSLLPVNNPLPPAEAEQLRSVREAVKGGSSSAATAS